MSQTATSHAQKRSQGPLDRTPIFDRRDVHPFDEIEWEIRDAVIGDPENPAFEQRGVEFPKSWSPERDQHRRPEVLPRPARQRASASPRSNR